MTGTTRACAPISWNASAPSSSDSAGPLLITASADATSFATSAGSPEWNATAAYTSGYPAARFAAIAAPAEIPARNTCLRSIPSSRAIFSVRFAMIAASPAPRRICPGSYQFQHLRGCADSGCSGYNTTNPSRAAASLKRVPRAMSSASCVHPWRTTTKVRCPAAGIFSADGRNSLYRLSPAPSLKTPAMNSSEREVLSARPTARRGTPADRSRACSAFPGASGRSRTTA